MESDSPGQTIVAFQITIDLISSIWDSFRIIFGHKAMLVSKVPGFLPIPENFIKESAQFRIQRTVSVEEKLLPPAFQEGESIRAIHEPGDLGVIPIGVDQMVSWEGVEAPSVPVETILSFFKKPNPMKIIHLEKITESAILSPPWTVSFHVDKMCNQ